MPPFFNSFKSSHLNCNFPAHSSGTAHCGFNSYLIITEAERFLHPFINHSLNLVHGLSGITSLAETDEIKMYTYVYPFPFQTVVKNIINQNVYIFILADFGFVWWMKPPFDIHMQYFHHSVRSYLNLPNSALIVISVCYIIEHRCIPPLSLCQPQLPFPTAI